MNAPVTISGAIDPDSASGHHQHSEQEKCCVFTFQRQEKSSKHTAKIPSEPPWSWIGEGRKALTPRAGEFLQNTGKELGAIAKEYTSLLEVFLSELPVQQHIDLKFLLFRLDFTELYSQL
ncbi:unnamed protein product [Linum trigynum]|uniref:Gamma-tubulin complex component n=1 Tax=Linum trigynum TaxID=586398 RepID=A0AAV2F9I2_9ROSI